MTLAVRLLIDHPESVTPLAEMMEAEWADWYNPRGASARADLSERLRRDGLPLGLVALVDGIAVGTCALTASSGGLVTERSPWLGGLLVDPLWRRRGIAAALLAQSRTEAQRLGFRRLYALSAEASALFRHEGWVGHEVTQINDVPHTVFSLVW